MKKILFLVAIISFIGCKTKDKEKESASVKENSGTISPDTKPDSLVKVIPYDSILKIAKIIMGHIKEKDFGKLSSFISKDASLGFSSNAYITKEDLLLKKEEVAGLWNNGKKYTWGIGDASGEPIIATVAEYYKTYIYSNDFANAAKIEVNKLLQGNTTSITNFQEIYPGSAHVDFHFPNSGEDKFDWSTLRLIFINQNGSWYLRHIQQERYSI